MLTLEGSHLPSCPYLWHACARISGAQAHIPGVLSPQTSRAAIFLHRWMLDHHMHDQYKLDRTQQALLQQQA